MLGCAQLVMRKAKIVHAPRKASLPQSQSVRSAYEALPSWFPVEGYRCVYTCDTDTAADHESESCLVLYRKLKRRRTSNEGSSDTIDRLIIALFI